MPENNKKPRSKTTKAPAGKKPVPKSAPNSALPVDDFHIVGIGTSAGGLEALDTEQKFRIAIDNTFDLEYWLAPDGKIIYLSPSAKRITGYSPRELIKNPGLLLEMIHEEDKPSVEHHFAKISDEGSFQTIFRIKTKSGKVRWIQHACQPVFDDDGKWLGRRASNRDITELKQIEDLLRIERDKLKEYLNIAGNIIVSMDDKGLVTLINKKGAELLGYPQDEILGKDWFETFIPAPARKNTKEVFQKLIKGEVKPTEFFENPVVIKSGEERIIAWHNAILKDAGGKTSGTLSSGEDITERKKRDDELRHINRELRAISDCNQVMVRAKTEHELCTAVSTIMCDVAGYRMAWVGVAEHDKAKSVRPCGWGGYEEGYLTESKFSWADNDYGRGPTGKAIRSGKTQFMQDFDTVPEGTPWRRAAMARGYRSSIALPLKDISGEVIGAFMLYADRPNAFIPEEVKLLEELAGDLAYGIMALRDRAERKLAEEELRQSQHDLNRAQTVGKIGSWRLDLQKNELVWSDENYRLFGVTPGTPMTYESFLAIVHPDDRAHVDEKWSAALAGAPYNCEHRIVVGNEIRWVRELAELDVDENGQLLAGFGTTQDITERKQAEKELQRLNRELRAISDCNQVMVRATDEQSLCQEVSRIICDIAGYRMAWVGNAEHDKAKTIRPIAWCGEEDGYLTQASFTWADKKKGQRPGELAVRTGKTHFIQDIKTDPAAQLWGEDALAKGFRSSLAIPLFSQNQKVLGCFVLYAGEPNGFTPDEIKLMEELAGDLAYGIESLRARAERDQAEVALTESEEKFRAITENAQMLIGVSSIEDGTVLYLNPAYEKAFGYKQHEMIGHKGPELWVDPSQRKLLMDILKSKGSVTDYEIEVKRKDGTHFWVISNITIINYSGVPSIIGAMLDITERKGQEEKLRNSEERFRTLFTSMSEGVCEHEIIYDKKGKPVDYRILECNPTYEQITQIPRDKAVGKTASELYRTGKPPYFDIYIQVSETGEPAYFETYFPPMKKHFAISVFSPGKGKFVTVFQDVTERKRQEEEIRSIAKFPGENPNAVLRVKSDGTVIYANAGSKSLLKFWETTVGGKLPKNPSKLAARALESGKTTEIELNIGEQDLLLLFTPIRGEDYVNIYGKDVTERKKAEEALHKAHALLEAVTSGTEVIIAAIDQDYRYIFFNQAYKEEMVKLTGKQISIGMSMLDALADMPEQQASAKEEWSSVLNGERTDKILRFGDPGKYRRVYSVHHVPLLTSGGAVFGAGEAAVDVTAIEQAREELQMAHDDLEHRVEERTGDLILANQALVKEQRRFQEVLDMLPVYIILLDKDYHVPFDNKFFRERFGESFGKRCFDYLFHRTEPCEICETYKVYDQNKPLEWEWTGPDGHNYYIYDFPFTDTDGSQLIMEVGVDITERKRAEAALQQAHDELEMRVEERTLELKETRDYLENLINCANAPIIVWDLESRITLFNHAFERLTGRTTDEILGQKLDILFPEESREHAMTHVNGATRGKRMEVEEIPILCTDGKVCTVLWNSATLYDANGKAVATIAQGQDITERKVAEESLMQRTVDLEQANRELEAFSFSVSHDLRAPLRSIDGFSQLILRRYFDKLDDKGRDYLDELRRSSQLMAQLMDDILTLSRISRYELSRDRIDLSALAISVARDLKKNQTDHNVEFVMAHDLEAMGDERLIKIVLENLLGNSYKFTGKTKKAKIEVGITEIKGEKAFFVRDNGAGFDMAYIDKLFKPFHRLHTPNEFPGTGIGLASVQRIIERHGGKVWAEAALDKGATFYFTLPA